MTKKLTVTCTCGSEVPVPRNVAAQVMVAGRKDNSEHMRAISRKGVEARRRNKLSTSTT